MNLLTNAVKYTKTGSVMLTMHNGGIKDGYLSLDVEVRDTGAGIKEEDMEKLYESFARIEEKRNRNIEGTGLGMSIVVRLLRMMDSELSVKSEYGMGSRFSFTVRQQIIDMEPLGNYEERIRASRVTEDEEKNISMAGARVLVVDDYQMNLMVMQNFLGLYEIDPILVESGKAAIEAIRDAEFDLVFLDHMMPGLDGIETLAKIREEGLMRKDMHVIAITANAIVGARETYIEAGFDDYLSKPIEVGKLEDTLLKYLPAKYIKRGKEE